MIQFIDQFISDHLQFILGFVAGGLALSLRWLRKHPEDWYSLEEIDPDIDTEAFSDDYKA